MTYKEKLLNPRWQKKRLEILSRDNFACQCCFNKESTLHIHHMAYLRGLDIWDIPDYMLITLCENCHRNIQKFDWELATEIFKQIFLPSNLFLLALDIEKLLKKNTVKQSKLLEVLREVLSNNPVFENTWEIRKEWLNELNPNFDIKNYE